MNTAMRNNEPLYIIKIGGNIIDDPKTSHAVLQKISKIKEKKILVHGGGKVATAVGKRMGIQADYIDGRRITNDETIDLVTMVYGGLINKKMVASLQSMNCNAMGITGADNNLMPAKKRPVDPIDFGWVGDVDIHGVNAQKWNVFLDNDIVPVVAPLTHDGNGNMLNTNADTIASVLSVALSECYEVKLMYCFEKDGVLLDVNNENSVIRKLDRPHYEQLLESGSLFDGILPKIDNAFDAANNGVAEVRIGNSSKLELLIKGESGTKIEF